MSWHNVFKFFCWVGWHVWEYVYKGTGDDGAQRQCKHCGTSQLYSKQIGKWNYD